MNTDKICEILGKQAVKRHRDALDQAAKNYHRALGLRGTNEVITLRDKEGKELKIMTCDIWNQITEHLIKKHSERLASQEISEFVNNVGNFQQQLAQLSQFNDS